MWRSSAMTVGRGSRGAVFCSVSATAVPLFRLPEVDESEGPGEYRPAQREEPHVRGQVLGAVAVDQREADQVHVDGGGVPLKDLGDPARQVLAGEHRGDTEHDT